uniref:Putative secreted protein n=1 Tax=Anopheles darlingi TaxID=43151 RepID=A0A2M4DB36_ANODA
MVAITTTGKCQAAIVKSIEGFVFFLFLFIPFCLGLSPSRVLVPRTEPWENSTRINIEPHSIAHIVI